MGVIAPMSVIDVVTISSPGSGSTAATAAWIAAVPDVVQRQNGVPTCSANRFSKRVTIVPLVQFSVPDAMTSARSSSSSLPNDRPVAFASEGSVTLLVLMKDSFDASWWFDAEGNEWLGDVGFARERQQCLLDALARPSVAERIRSGDRRGAPARGRRVEYVIERLLDDVGIRAHQPIRAPVDTLRALGRSSEDEDRNAERRRLFLNTARIGHDHGRAGHGFHELHIGKGRYELCILCAAERPSGRLLDLWVQVHGIDEVDVGVTIGGAANRAEDVVEHRRLLR